MWHRRRCHCALGCVWPIGRPWSSGSSGGRKLPCRCDTPWRIETEWDLWGWAWWWAGLPPTGDFPTGRSKWSCKSCWPPVCNQGDASLCLRAKYETPAVDMPKCLPGVDNSPNGEGPAVRRDIEEVLVGNSGRQCLKSHRGLRCQGVDYYGSEKHTSEENTRLRISATLKSTLLPVFAFAMVCQSVFSYCWRTSTMHRRDVCSYYVEKRNAHADIARPCAGLCNHVWSGMSVTYGYIKRSNSGLRACLSAATQLIGIGCSNVANQSWCDCVHCHNQLCVCVCLCFS